MALRPFAIDGLVISEGVDYSDASVVSLLVEATGLGQVQPQYARRHGRRPVISGVELPARRLFLESWFVDNYWKANKRLLYQYLNAERGETRRLLAGDSVPPGLAMQDGLLAMGPWDVYVDDDAAWHVRDLLQPDDVEADLSGAVHFIGTDQTSATVVDEATINYLHNPVAGGSSGYNDYGTGTVSRTSSYDLYSDCDEYAYQIDCLAENDGGQWTLDTLANEIHVVSFWRRDSEALTLQVSLDGTNWHTVAQGQSSGLWTRYEAEIPAAQANGSTTLTIRTTGGAYTAEPGVWTTSDSDAWSDDAADADAWTSFEFAVTIILDGLQVEKSSTVSTLVWGGLAGYSWEGTAHNSATQQDWHVDAGDEYDDQTRAIVIEEATTNLVKNPVAGAAGNFGNVASGTVARSQDVYLFDQQNLYSFKITTTASGDGGSWTIAAAANAIHFVTFWQYGQAPNDIQVSLDNSNWHDVAETVADGDWTRYGAQIPAAQANGSTTLYIKQNGAGAGSFYVDGLQVEQKLYPTSLCHGAMGEEYAWDSTEHGSKSTRTVTKVDLSDEVTLISANSSLTFHLVVQMPYAADDDWPDEAILCDARGASDNARIYLEYEDSDDKFHVYINGSDRFQSSAQTFSAGDWLHLTLVVDFAGEARLYVDGSRDGCTSITGLDAPTLTDWMLGSDYNGANQANIAIAEFLVAACALNCSEAAWLYAQDPWRARWLDVLAEHPQPRSEGGRRLAFATVTPLDIDGDIRWRSRDGDVAFWRVHATGEDLRVTVTSEDEVYPELRITPTAAKSGGFDYKRFSPVVWNSDSSAGAHPICIEPADLTGKAQADGDDVRVYVDGVEVDRWLGGTVPSAMKIWCYMDFEPAASATLGVAIGSGDTITTITASTSISDFPSSGLLFIDSEVFIYTAKNSTTSTFSGVTRAARGTSAAAHTTSDTIYWIQHDVWVYYGDSTLSAPDVDDDYKPAFDLDNSDNGSWDYNNFGEDDELRGMQWAKQVIQYDSRRPNWDFYTANHKTDADPWEEIGIFEDTWEYGVGSFCVYSPLPISNVNFANGERYTSFSSGCDIGYVESSIDGSTWTTEYTITTVNPTTWENWSYNSAITSGTHYVRLRNRSVNSAVSQWRIECADVTLTLDSSYTPDVTVGDEQNNYPLNCTIINSTTGEAITLEVNIEVDTVLIVNTDTKTVSLVDGTKLQYALTPDSTRRDWLRLTPGVNDLDFAETGANELEIEIIWDRRYFE